MRNRLYEDPALGCGNFLAKCHADNPLAGVDFMFLEEPIELSNGTALSSLSLDSLFELTRHLASWYLTRDVNETDVVGVCVREGVPVFLHYLALTSIGAIPALINPAMPAEVAAEYVRQNGIRRVQVDSTTRNSGLRGYLAADCLLDFPQAYPSFDAAPLPPRWPYEPEDSTIVMLCHTSGTTGLPKAVQFGHRQFFIGKRSRLKHFSESDDDRMLSALPHSHSAGISYLMTATLLGIPTLVLSNLVGDGVRRQLLRFKPTIVTAFPQTYASLVAANPTPDEYDFVRQWFCMADAAHEAHIRRILVASPKSRLIDAFGSNELGMALLRRESTITDVARRRLIGRPVEFADAKILEEGTFKELPSGAIGLLAIRSPTITPGYWLRPDLTSVSWRNGYWLTGDVAVQRNGEFFHLDRAVDVIQSAVGPLYTLLLEEEIQQIDGVCDVSIVGCVLGEQSHESIVALVLPEQNGAGREQIDPDRIRDAITRSAQSGGKTLPPDAVCVAIAPDYSSFPRGSTGKVLKRTLRESFADIYREFCESGKAPDGIVIVQPNAKIAELGGQVVH